MKKLLWALFYLFIFCFLACNSFSYLDPDFGWHLRFGQIIWESRSLPHDQLFMWTLAGKQWVDHEWLGNLLVYGLWSAGGYLLISAFFILLPLGAIFLANRYIFKHYDFSDEGRFLAACLEIGGLFAMRGHLGVRLQEFTFLFLIVLLIIIDTVRRRHNYKAFLWALPLVYAWACLHGGFLIAFAVISGWLAYEWAIALWPRFIGRFAAIDPLPRRCLAMLSGSAIVIAAATLFTPYGLELYSFLGGYRDTYYMSYIQEWLPPYAFPANYSQLAANTFIAGLAAWALSLRVKNSLFAFLAVSGFWLLAFRSMRHFPLLVAASIVLLFPLTLPPLAPALSAKQKRLIGSIAGLCLACVSFVLVAATRITSEPFSSYCRDYPCRAARFLNDHPKLLEGNLFNYYSYGGYLIGTWERPRLFIDGRLPQYSYGGKTILEEYNNFNKPDTGPKLLEEHAIATVLLRKAVTPTPPDWFETWVLGYKPALLDRPYSPLADYLASAKEWRIAYEDDSDIIYVRR